MTTPVPIRQASLMLGVSEPTLRRWIRNGAPCLQLGSAGRGKGSIVDIDAIRLWQARRHGVHGVANELLPQIAEALSDVLKRDGGDGRPAHLRLGIAPRAAAELLTAAYGRISRAVGSPETDHD
jgi:hypothetical protein